MKFASEHSVRPSPGLAALSMHFPANKNWAFVRIFVFALAVPAVALLCSLLLPAPLVSLFQDLACWALVGGMGFLALLISVKVIDGLLGD